MPKSPGDNFTRDRFLWLDQVACETPHAASVAIRLAKYFNRKSGLAWPKQQTLAGHLGTTRDAVQIQELLREEIYEALGELSEVEGGGRGIRSQRRHLTVRPNVRYWGVISTGRRNTGGQQAINNDDGLPNARPIAFSDCPRNQPSHNTICSAVLLPLRNH